MYLLGGKCYLPAFLERGALYSLSMASDFFSISRERNRERKQEGSAPRTVSLDLGFFICV